MQYGDCAPKIQKTIALSTAEAEYYAALEFAIEIMYLSNLFDNMGFKPDDDTPVDEDYRACIEWGNYVLGGRERAKHIDIHKHFAHEDIHNRHVRLIKVGTDDLMADIPTKALLIPAFERCVEGVMRGVMALKGP